MLKTYFSHRHGVIKGKRVLKNYKIVEFVNGRNDYGNMFYASIDYICNVTKTTSTKDILTSLRSPRIRQVPPEWVSFFTQ